MCEMNGYTCIFAGVKTSESSPLFAPLAFDYKLVKAVEFTDSVMHTLTDELCKMFPYMKALWANTLSIEQIAPNALHDCKNLTHVSFESNKLKKLDPNVFEGNSKLEIISLKNNLLRELDGNIFEPLTQLQTLSLSSNLLTELPLPQFPKLEKLEVLWISSNKLTNIDDQELFRKFPKLKKISLQNNLFDCARLRIILDALRSSTVQVVKTDVVNGNSNLTTIENVECVNEIQQTTVNDEEDDDSGFILMEG